MQMYLFTIKKGQVLVVTTRGRRRGRECGWGGWGGVGGGALE